MVKLIRNLHQSNPGWYKSSNAIITITVGGVEVKLHHRNGLVMMRTKFADYTVDDGWIEGEISLPNFGFSTAYQKFKDQLDETKPKKKPNPYYLDW